jgi:hypothetical protein
MAGVAMHCKRHPLIAAIGSIVFQASTHDLSDIEQRKSNTTTHISQTLSRSIQSFCICLDLFASACTTGS